MEITTDLKHQLTHIFRNIVFDSIKKILRKRYSNNSIVCVKPMEDNWDKVWFESVLRVSNMDSIRHISLKSNRCGHFIISF